MNTLQTILAVADVLICLVLIVAVLMQHGKSANLSGAITGSSETFFGKNRSRSKDATFARATTVVGIIFVLITIWLNIIAFK